jgi:hypothetical protein
MAVIDVFQSQREFRCSHCSGKILVPRDLPPMTGPCPHCGSTITSPGPEPELGSEARRDEASDTMVSGAHPGGGPPPLPPAAPLPPEPPADAAPAETARAGDVAERALAEAREQAAAAARQEHLSALATAQAEADAKAREQDRALAEATALAASLAEAKARAESAALARERELEQARAAAEAKARADAEALTAAKELAETRALEEAKALEEARARAEALAKAEAKARADHERELAEARAEAEAKSQAETRAMAAEWAARERESREKEAREKAALAKALSDEKAAALERAANAEKALADEKASAAGKAAELEQQLSDEKARAAARQQDLTHERAAAEQKSQAYESALAQARLAAPAALPVAAEPAAEARVVVPPEPTAKRPNRTKKPKSSKKPRPAKPPGPPSRKRLLAALLMLLVLIFAAGGTWIYLGTQLGRGRSSARPTINAAAMAQIREKKYLESGWQDEARKLLSQFLDADSAAGKAACSLRGSELLAAMDLFYGGGRIDDSDTALSGFSVEPLPPDDQRRGIFMMRYDQPPQFEMRDFFRPLAPLEVQYGLQEPDLLLGSLARAGNFTTEPVKVHVFFKRTPDGLRLDWETFIQTKHRTFREFTELPDPGRSAMFRLFVVEDVPERGREQRGMKTYRMADPAHKTDSVRVDVPIDSELGRSLSILNWRGVKDARPTARTATLELEWSDDPSPQLTIKRFICWEFLGIGGQALAPQIGQ